MLGLMAALLLLGAATAVADPAPDPAGQAPCDPIYWTPGTPPQPNVNPRCLGPVLDNRP